ncbi:MAG: hypothetical protein E6J90_37720 [Deltaproteobacteria bacterium]|nr:MAG: hypothetical protein E6J90_37720 [Deltaproteobacteria bacterium]
MSDGISQNTQAILLLTAPLIVGRSSEGGEAPLSANEYGRLAVDLHSMSRQPADLLSPGAEEILAATKAGIEPSRLRRLLARGFQLSQAVERWHARAIWIISRADSMYPRRLKSRLREIAPPVLYGCGHASLLEAGGLAIVGSRDAEEELLRYADETARRVAGSREAVVSGGARGIDQTAMRAALSEGGNVSGVLSDSLERAALARENREFLMERRLVLISPFDPSAGFNVGHAMQRNKLVYALADAALVVSTDHNKGGTWTGAVEQLEKLHYVCVYVRSSGNTTEGIRALVKKGAVPWPEPRDAQALRAALQAQPSPTKMPPQSGLPFAEGLCPDPIADLSPRLVDSAELRAHSRRDMTTIAITPDTLSEQLLYSTVRLVCGDSVGTGFFFHTTLHGRPMPLIVTNRHVLAPSDITAIGSGTTIDVELEVHGHKLTLADGKAAPSGVSHVVRIPKHTWFGHPDPTVDLAVMPVASVDALDKELFRIGLMPGHVWPTERLRELSVLEEVTMCGAPKGLWDEIHGLPMFRRGTTANHPAIDHRGKPIGVVDIACFPGSSGSPICVINEGSYPNKRQTAKDGGVVFGNRLVLLGILYGGPVHNARGELEITALPTTAKITPVVPQMVHLGYYVKAREILAIVAELEARPVVADAPH